MRSTTVLVAFLVCALSPSSAQDKDDELKGSIKGADGPVKVFRNSERPIAVTVTRAGKPAAKVELSLVWFDPRSKSLRKTSMQSDAKGRVELKGKNGFYVFDVAPSTGWFGTVQGRLDFGDESLDLALPLKEARTLQCRFVGKETKEPLAKTRVEIFGPGISRSMTSDGEGKITVAQLTDGEYEVTVYPKGKLSASFTLRARDEPQDVVVPLDTRARERDVVAAVKVRLANGEQGAPPKTLTLRVAGSTFALADGALQLGRWPIGWDPLVVVEAGADDYALVEVSGLPLKPDQPVGILLVEKIPVRVQVVSDDEPLAGAEVTVDGTALKESEAPGSYEGKAKLPSGQTVQLSASCKGFAPRTQAAQIQGVLRVSLERVFTVEGRVRFEGEPADAVLVLAGRERIAAETGSGEGGAFTLTDVPRGAYTLYAIPSLGSKKTGWSKMPVEVKGTGTKLDVRLSHAIKVTGVLNTNRKPPLKPRALLLSAQGVNLGPRFGGTMVDAEGRFELHVSAGTYDVVLQTDVGKGFYPLKGRVVAKAGANWLLVEPELPKPE